MLVLCLFVIENENCVFVIANETQGISLVNLVLSVWLFVCSFVITK